MSWRDAVKDTTGTTEDGKKNKKGSVSQQQVNLMSGQERVDAEAGTTDRQNAAPTENGAWNFFNPATTQALDAEQKSSAPKDNTRTTLPKPKEAKIGSTYNPPKVEEPAPTPTPKPVEESRNDLVDAYNEQEEEEQKVSQSLAGAYKDLLADNSKVENIPTEPRVGGIGRWAFNLENGWVMPFWAEDWRQRANTESTMKPTQYSTGKEGNSEISNALSDTARERRLNRIAGQWKNFQIAIKQGTFGNPADGTLRIDEILGHAKRIIGEYKAAGGGNELFVYGDILGGFNAKKSQATQKLLREAILAEEGIERLDKALADGTYDAHDNQAGWDKLSDLSAKLLSDSGAAISDEEKVRNQYLTQPEAAKQAFITTLGKYQNLLTGIMQSGGSSEYMATLQGRLNQIDEVFREVSSTTDPRRFAIGLGKLFLLAKSDDSFLPKTLSAVDSSAKKAWDEYKEGMIREAKVDPGVLRNLLLRLRSNRIARYSSGVRDLGGEPRTFKEIIPENPATRVWQDRFSKDFAGSTVDNPTPKLVIPENPKGRKFDSSEETSSRGKNKRSGVDKKSANEQYDLEDF